MEDEILDYFDDNDTPAPKIIAIKYFYFESKARLYAARLEEEGIPSFVSNTNSITAFPLGDAGIGLHIREADREAALTIIRHMDQLDRVGSAGDESFRDADLDDIAYQKQLHEQEKRQDRTVQYIIAAIIVLVLIRMVWRAFNPDDSFDVF